MIHLAKTLSQAVDHFFPEFNVWLGGIRDHRHPLLITYELPTIVWLGLVMYLTRRGSRRQIGIELREGRCVEGLKVLSGQKGLEQVPHGDTLEHYMRKAEVSEFEKVNALMIRRLIRMRALEGARLQGHYLVAVDGVHVCTFDYDHCPNCTKRKHRNGKIQWQHYKVQASLITPNGLCLPMGSVWIENEEFYDKQDCELKAAKRLLKKLRTMYPQLKMCLLIDSLYARETMFEVMEDNRMEWIVVFKEGTMPEVYQWIKQQQKRSADENRVDTLIERRIQGRSRRDHSQRLEREVLSSGAREKKIERFYTWITGVAHWQNKRKYNIFENI